MRLYADVCLQEGDENDEGLLIRTGFLSCIQTFKSFSLLFTFSGVQFTPLIFSMHVIFLIFKKSTVNSVSVRVKITDLQPHENLFRMFLQLIVR